jgi:type III pantothenate kinase
VDAGTALTLDWVSRGGSHLGGYIIPGLNQQLKALLAGTERVFADRWSELNTLSPGRDTSECVLNGLLAQFCGFIGFQAESAASAGIDKLVLTGGDSGLLAPHLKPIVERYSVALELRPRLVFEGLLAVTRKLDKKS